MAVLTSSLIVDAILVLLSTFVTAYLFVTRRFNYWKSRGVMEVKPIPFFGNFKDVVLFRKSPAVFLGDVYAANKDEKVVGIYVLDKPCLVLRDPAVIRNVLVKDFAYFCNRHVTANEKDIAGMANLFFLKNPAWRNLRSKLTPAFSTGKMKNMFLLMSEVGEDLVTHMDAILSSGDNKVVEFREISAKYTTDIIASCAFGLRVNCLNNPDAEFRKYGGQIFAFTYKRALEFFSMFFIPNFVKIFGFKIFRKEATDFMREVFYSTLKARIESGVKRNDLIDILIELKDSQTNLGDDDEFVFEGDQLVAQTLVFFAAGFETLATLMSFLLYELALNPDIQDRLRTEITTVVAKNDGQITHDLVLGISYLDMVTSETLRKYPSLPFLDRVAVKDYNLPGTDLTIEKGTPVYVPMYGLHHDPEYFPDPEKFDPERFSAENKRKIPPFVYMPFGEGPHNCIGMRFGLLQAKTGVVRMLMNYELSPCDETIVPVEIEVKALITAPKGGLKLRVRKLNH